MSSDKKPTIPGLLATGAGRRVYRRGDMVVIQDQNAGWWVKFRPTKVADGREAVPRSKVGRNLALALAVGGPPAGFPLVGPLDLQEVIAAVTTGRRPAPPVPVPTVEQIESAVKRRNAGPDASDAEAECARLLATLVSALACKGGRCTGPMLRHDLQRRLSSSEDVQKAIRVALWCKRVEVRREGEVEQFSMHLDWDAPLTPIPGMPAIRHGRQVAQVPSDFFDEE